MNIYLQKFFNSNAAADLLPIFGNYKDVKIRDKEIMESMAMLEAATTYAKLDRKANIQCYVVGDGKYPRTSSILAFYTSWNVVGIDPIYNMEWIQNWRNFKLIEGRAIKRLSFLNSTIESANIKKEVADGYLIILPHSHASMTSTMTKFAESYGSDTSTTIINMPCCVQFSPKLSDKKVIDNHGYLYYIDLDVSSAKNAIHIWNHISLDDYQKLTAKRKNNGN